MVISSMQKKGGYVTYSYRFVQYTTVTQAFIYQVLALFLFSWHGNRQLVVFYQYASWIFYCHKSDFCDK